MENRFQSQSYLQGDQYAGSANLSRRANLHSRFRTHSQPWQRWLFERLQLEPGSRILECGAGAGWLWQDNLARLPAGCRITLTDFAGGMVAELRDRFGDHPQFSVEPADIQQLPFDDGVFDVVIANHMLYHVPEIDRALAEVRRVLGPGGRFFCATNGFDHLLELSELTQSASATFVLHCKRTPDTFTLENGRAQLSRHFDAIALSLYDDTLRVTEAQPVIDYLLSSSEARAHADELWIDRTRAAIERQIADRGAFTVRKATGLFAAHRAENDHD